MFLYKTWDAHILPRLDEELEKVRQIHTRSKLERWKEKADANLVTMRINLVRYFGIGVILAPLGVGLMVLYKAIYFVRAYRITAQMTSDLYAIRLRELEAQDNHPST